MTDFVDSRQIVSSFLAARLDPNADALDLMDEAFVFESPLMQVTDRDVYLRNHRGFQVVVKRTRLISELYGPDEATLLYELETDTPAVVQKTAEHFRIANGKIASILVIFDSAPWRPIFEQGQSDS